MGKRNIIIGMLLFGIIVLSFVMGYSFCRFHQKQETVNAQNGYDVYIEETHFSFSGEDLEQGYSTEVTLPYSEKTEIEIY